MTHTKQNRLSARFLAVVTLTSLLLSAFPAPFFVAEASSDVFIDSFESNPAFSSPSWTNDPHWGTDASDSRTGSKQAKAVGNESGPGSLETSIDTTDYENVELSFWYKKEGMDDGDDITVEWYDGSSWNLITTISGIDGKDDDSDEWIEYSTDLPGGADDNPDFALRFTSDMNSPGNDKFYLEDVNLSGEEIEEGQNTSETIVITGDTTTSGAQPEVGWMFNRDPNNQTPFEFNDDMPGIGTGSLYIEPITNTVQGNSDKFIGELFFYEEIEDVESISYDFKLGAGSDGEENHFYASVYLTLPTPNGWYDCRYSVVPDSGSTGSFTTVTFDPTETYPVTSKVPASYVCPAKPADMPEGSTLNFFAINVGDTSGNDTDVSGYLDNVVTVVKDDGDTHTTTYDFEPATEEVTVVATKVICEDEADLPNWQDGGGANITADTAADWVAQHDGCYIDPTWHFQWYPDNILHDGVGDDTFTGPKGNGWSETFTGTTTINIEEIEGLSFREVLEPGYIPFTYLTEGKKNTDNVTAEFNCSTGGKNYDNLEWAQNVEDGDTIYCVAFNTPKENEVPQECTSTATADLNETPSQNNVVDTITEFIIDGDTYESGDSFDLFVLGDAEASNGVNGDDNVRIKRTADGFELYFYGNGSQDVREFSGSFMLDNVDASGATITAGNDPLEFGGTWPDQIAIDTNTGEVTFTLYTNTANDSFIVRGLRQDCDEVPEPCVDQLDGDWADNVEEFDQGKTKNGGDVAVNRSNPEDATGEADWSNGLSDGFVSLGFGGSIVVSFDSYVPNVDGDDISIHEATNGTYPLETALIEVSQNGSDWYEVGTAGNTGVSYFDFDSTGLAWIKYVRITDTTNPALHGGSADAFDLDAIDATQTVCEEPEEPEMCSVTVVSDDTNEVDETNDFAKALSFIHTGWTADIADADWIWGDNPVVDPTVDETQTFIKEFEWSGGIASAMLDIAADNYYTVYINDVEVVSEQVNPNNFQLATQDNDIDVSSYINTGVNTLKIEATNKGVANSTYKSNPAGLRYNLTIISDETGDECMYAPDAGLVITKPEVDDEVLSGEYTFEAEYTDADDDYDNMQWAIRFGTCKSNSGTVAGNVDGFNTPFDWDGASFSSTIDMDEWEEGEYCFVANPKEDGGTNFRETRWFTLEHPEPEQCLIVSDTNTIVVENNDYAVETWDEHNNWTHDIMDALWIWDSYFVEDPEVDTTRTFKETFTVSGLEEAKFYIAADNTYSVYINDVLAYERLNSNNYQTHDTYTDVADYLVEGDNELVVEVTNLAQDGGIPKSNPAGALFKLKMEVEAEGECESTTAPEDDNGGGNGSDDTFVLNGYKWNDEDGDGIWDENEDSIAGWTIYAANGEQTLSTTTDANGYYYFEVEEDSWEVYEATVSGWTQTGIVIDIDEESDGYIDGNSCIFDIDTEESKSDFEELSCNFGNYEEPVISTTDDGGSSGGGGGSYTHNIHDSSNARVLGVSTDDICPQYLTETIMPGRDNNPSEVTKLQEFLNSFEGYNLAVTGFYGDATQNAVGEFQEKYFDEVLAPWGLTARTLNVYYTTRRTINRIYCEWTLEFPLTESEQSEVDWFRNLGQSYQNSQTVGFSSASVGSDSDGGDDNNDPLTQVMETLSGEGDSNGNSQAASASDAGGGFWGGFSNFFGGLFGSN